jgi:predicted ABC-type transport system involved in lysophospholipase L1 biosynthesis ATPase subunit
MCRAAPSSPSFGPSGCGKSTLLRLIAGLDAPSAGSITIDGAPETRRFGLVFQEPVLLPWLTAIENVRFPLDMAGADRAAATARAGALLALVGLGGFEASLPDQISGGMRQRTAIARALSYDPPILLRIASTQAVTAAVIGESMGANRGLGYLLSSAQESSGTAAVIGVILILALIGWACHEAVRAGERRLLAWHPSQRVLLGRE